MNLTSKGRYAVTAMLDLAMHASTGATPLSDISQRQSISRCYLEQLFRKLRKAQLVNSSRGPGGGYRLARPPENISLAHIIDAVDEIIDNTGCQEDAPCDQNHHCLSHRLWYRLSEEINDYLSRTSLHDLMQREGIQRIANRQDLKMANANHQ